MDDTTTKRVKTKTTEPPDEKGYYDLFMGNRDVNAGITPILALTVSTRFRCADQCLLNKECESFSYGVLSGVCKLYDTEYTDELVEKNDGKLLHRTR